MEQRNTQEDLHVGKNGWLYLTGGSNQPLRFYTDTEFLTQRHVSGWVDRIRNRSTKAKQLGADFFHFFAPDKLSIYAEFCEVKLVFFERRPGNLVRQAVINDGLGKHILDVETALLQAKLHNSVYWKTDTHWTAHGTLAVYKAVCEKLGVIPRVSLENAPFKDSHRLMDLGRKLNPPALETLRLYDISSSAKRVHTNVLVDEAEALSKSTNISGLQSGAYVAYKNDNPQAHDAKLVLFGDSYSELRPRGLTAMFAETFREVHFFWSSSVDFRKLEAIRPDFVVSELAERFARVLPNDARDLDAYAMERLQAHRSARIQ